jgi:hypothetical protein
MGASLCELNRNLPRRIPVWKMAGSILSDILLISFAKDPRQSSLGLTIAGNPEDVGQKGYRMSASKCRPEASHKHNPAALTFSVILATAACLAPAEALA